jgi:glycosyltransferase involved in cell wall biosynthesis
MPRVCHLTTVHPPRDVRIFTKMCRSLARAGYDTHLVAPAPADSVMDGVAVHALPRARNRIERMLLSSRRCLAAAQEVRADLYHFHDPELIPIGLALKRAGHTVVYDVHESHAEHMLDRAYLPVSARKTVSRRVAAAERQADARLDAVVAATPKIARTFSNPNTTLVQNFPVLAEMAGPDAPAFEDRAAAAAYVGSVSAVRGAWEMVEALEQVPEAGLVLAGDFVPPTLQAELAARPGWARVRALGFQEREVVARELAQVRAGLVVLHPLRNYVESMPNKMFEYMAAGLPVVASDFAYWRELIGDYGCAVFIDPFDVDALAEALRGLLLDPDRAEAMGARGRAATQERFHWGHEEARLLELYARLIGPPSAG